MAKVTYRAAATKDFYQLSIGDYFIYNGKLYLKLDRSKTLNAFDFEENRVITFPEDAPIIFKSGEDIEITVNK